MMYDDSLGTDVLKLVPTYGDISLNQKERLQSDGVRWYLCPENATCPDTEPPPYNDDELKAQLRSWFLEESVARLWDYPEGVNPGGPWPLQVHHGGMDKTVFVENSRWLRNQMIEKDVPYDADHFMYFETPEAGHEVAELSDTSRVAMATLLQNKLGWTP